MIRPALWIVLLLGAVAGIPGIVAAAIGLALLFHGQLAGLLFVGFTAFILFMLSVALGGYLWADDRTVGNTRFFERGSVPREDLACLRLGPDRGRSGRSCLFVRKDGSVALRTVARVGELCSSRGWPRTWGCPSKARALSALLMRRLAATIRHDAGVAQLVERLPSK